MSSPSRLVIDPLIYSYPESHDSKTDSSASKALPPASKLLKDQQPSSGWTPYISKTIGTTDIMSYNSTPSSKMFPSLYKQNGQEFDYQGLNLTPFLNHSMNVLNNPNSASANNVSFTPFYEKSMHFLDMFMDSPIRSATSKMETITPSRFALQPELRVSSDPSIEPTLKRSITQIDTPARHPFKKQDKAKDESDSEDENQDENEQHCEKNTRRPSELKNLGANDHFATPSKRSVLKNVTEKSLNETPRKAKSAGAKNLYRTPAKQIPDSSPSTVIMSSATQSVDDEVCKAIIPPSPTPNKDRKETVEPVMGIFTEKKSNPEPKQSKKAAKRQQPTMNRFQIVFTDVHSLMNKKNKNGAKLARERREKSEREAKNSPQLASSSQNHNTSHIHNTSVQNTSHLASFQHTSSSLSQDFNSSMNTSGMFANSTANTSSVNISHGDHSSFELMHGGKLSTPKGSKFFLDQLFDRASPQSIHQMTQSFNHVHVNRSLDPLRGAHVESEEQRQYMPPPRTLTLQQAAQQALRHDVNNHTGNAGLGSLGGAPLNMNVMMSTPLRDHVIEGTGRQHADFSPTGKQREQFAYHHGFSSNSPSDLGIPMQHGSLTVDTERMRRSQRETMKTNNPGHFST